MIIRQEGPRDYDEVYELVKKSFATSTNEGEWDYLNEVRKKDTFIPELLLSPINVHPDFFRRGVARAMMTEAFRIAKDMGFTSIFLCGEPDFYHKFSFKGSYEYEIFDIVW